MKGLGTRILTAAVLLPLVVFLVYLGPRGLALLLGIFSILGGRELVRLLGARNPVRSTWIVAAGAILLMVSYGRFVPLDLPLALLIVATAAIAGEFLSEKRSLSTGLPMVIFASLYLGLFPAHLLGFYELGRPGRIDPWPVYYALVLVWGCDTGAYLFGSLLGRHRLWPSVSPSKSWEGALAGVAVSVALALLLGRWVVGSTLLARVGAGLLVGVLAQIGDLAESMMKREADRKDSGRAFPGHGGVLDRLDSLILAVPILYYWLRWSMTTS